MSTAPIAQGPVDVNVMPLRTLDVVLAILAVDTEAARRGEMFPQTSDEQCEDRRAVNRVVGMLRWYEENTGCARIKGWPSMPPPTPQQVSDYLAMVENIKDSVRHNVELTGAGTASVLNAKLGAARPGKD